MTIRTWYGSKWIRREKRLAIYLRDNWLCGYCGKQLEHEIAKQRTLDHVLSFAKGGTNAASNLITCCKRCNDQKQDRDAENCCRTTALRARLYEQLQKPLNIALAKAILQGPLDCEENT